MTVTMIPTTGDWVEVNDGTLEWFKNKGYYHVGKGPHVVVDWGYQDSKKILYIAIKFPDKLFYKFPVWESSCTKVRPPKQNLAAREREAMNSEPWRKFRDEYLLKVFKPEQRVVNVPKSPANWI